MDTEDILQLSVNDQAMFAISLMVDSLQLEGNFSSLNFSRYMHDSSEDIASEFEDQGCGGLSENEQRDRLRCLLISLSKQI